MAERITRQYLNIKLSHLAQVLGREVGREKGYLYLDYYAMGGGYMVVELSESGGRRDILSSGRLSAKQMCQTIESCINILRFSNENI